MLYAPIEDDAHWAARYTRLAERVQEPPPELARPLYIADHCCGWATHAACDALSELAEVRVQADALRIGQGMSVGPALDALLSRVAQTLRDADCLRGWRNELMDVFAVDARLGRIERAAMRPLGLLTRAVHLNAWTPDGKLWVARRALSKSTDPGMWDTLVGGLASSQEDLEHALLRECAEEAGLSPESLAARTPLRTVLRMHRRLPEGYQVEDILTSTCVLPANTRPANQDGEVMEIEQVSIADALRRIDAGEFTVEATLVILEDITRRRAHGEI
jgi:isopentenyldiphosphate isomerase